LQDAKQLPCTQILAVFLRISLDQVRQASQRLYYLYRTAETPLATYNSFAAQLGRSQLRHCEAFLQLARSQHIGGIAKADWHCRNHRRGIVVRVVIVRQRGEGVEPVFMLRSQLIQLTQRNDRRCRHLRASTLK
jgi:hypothetical protein